MTSSKITTLFFRQKWTSGAYLPNVYPSGWFECDILRITEQKLAYEIEIKVTVADFRNDAKKSIKTNIHQERTKYHILENGWQNSGSRYPRFRPNYFSYLVPAELEDVVREESPAWSGIWIVGDENRIKNVRKPKKLHSEPIADDFIWPLFRNLTNKHYRWSGK